MDGEGSFGGRDFPKLIGFPPRRCGELYGGMASPLLMPFGAEVSSPLLACALVGCFDFPLPITIIATCNISYLL